MAILNKEFLFDVVLLLFFSMLFALSFGFETGPFVVPFVVTLLGMVLILAKMIRNFSKAGQEKTIQLEAGVLKKISVIYAWLICLYVSLQIIGFTVSVPLFILAMTRFYFRENWRICILITVSVSIPAYIIFIELLEVYFPPGFVEKGIDAILRFVSS